MGKMIQLVPLCVYECTWYSLCAHVFVLLSVVYLCVQSHGAEGSLFQHQQADESSWPNSLEAELALLLFFLAVLDKDRHSISNLDLTEPQSLPTRLEF